MKLRTGLAFAVIACVVAGGGVLTANYDEWFVTPGLIEAKRGHVVQQMRDPSSVQFRDERLAGNGWLCGELNGKNAYGAYVGFKRFMSLKYDDAWVEGSGYAGKPEARSTARIIEHLDAQNEALRRMKAAQETTPNLPPLSREELDKRSEQDLFKQRWQKHCT